MFGFNFGNTYEATFEIYVGDQCVHKQTISTLEIMLKQQFAQIIQQIANESKPMRCKMIVKDIVWDKIDKKQIVLDNYVEFKNKLFEDEKNA